MITLYKSFVIPILEYCSVLLSPNKVGLIQRLKEVQKSFLRRIKDTSHNYWECLKQCKIYCLRRLRERKFRSFMFANGSIQTYRNLIEFSNIFFLISSIGFDEFEIILGYWLANLELKRVGAANRPS